MASKALIFDIQRSSLVDGDGVRTAIFFKGCNLRCKWCHNPEGLLPRVQMLVYGDRCRGCGECKSVCPSPNECTLCGKCALFCPSGARELCGKEYTARELLSEILKDKAYYEATGGGVTLTGGECLLQPEPLIEILSLCKENGINTAIDTAGNVPSELLERVFPYTDTFLYDIKCISEELHVEGTGVSNRQIIENLRMLKRLGADIIVRVPVIGGFNDTDAEMVKILDLVVEIKPRRCELLPYHPLGRSKCEALCVKFNEFETPTSEKISHFKSLATARGITL